MKCEKCGKEASFFYSSSVNGEHEEHCYCAGCAKEEGFEKVFSSEPMQMLSGMLGGVFSDMAVPARMLSAFDSFGGPLHAMLAMPGQASPSRRFLSEAEARIPEDAGQEVRARREQEALRQMLREAVGNEDYEKAAELRDRLREIT